MIAVALLSVVICGLSLIGLLITASPTTWLLTTVFSLWLGRRVWRWMQEPIPIDPALLFPPGSPRMNRDIN